MEKITGKNNDLIKGVKKLLSSSKERKSQALFVLEGARLVFDVLNSFCEVKAFLVTSQAYEKYKNNSDSLIERSEKSYIITDEISVKLSDTQNSQGIFAVCKMPDIDENLLRADGKYIALDNVQDPGNLGTIVRTAEALGLDGIIVGGGCDIYNPKALRASMGSMLRMNIYNTGNLSAYLENIKKLGLQIYGTVPDSSADKITEIDFSKGSVCVIGNEANGISDDVRNICTNLITIQMRGRAESLNASVAASITIWEMLR
ncbi:MAG: RNA methyltransferase [Acetobacter sp.]|nr:RNA methyltransferase [Bacteroides sp.]MCM1340731.1 RNA methyltransferase [Acetobacter sp.]MCM1433068.1 RNA methyltransferase [Clostridiales bacterium]